MRIKPKVYVAKWDKTVVVDVYQDGDFRMVVERNGRFQSMTDTQLNCFFVTNSEVEPDEAILPQGASA